MCSRSGGGATCERGGAEHVFVCNRLNDESRKLISRLGSAMIQSLGFRDNWVFVGGKGAAVTSHFEKVPAAESRLGDSAEQVTRSPHCPERCPVVLLPKTKGTLH